MNAGVSIPALSPQRRDKKSNCRLSVTINLSAISILSASLKTSNVNLMVVLESRGTTRYFVVNLLRTMNVYSD